jgi:hypothetical protein
MANAPQVGRDGEDIKVIWGERKQEYFCKRDWTTQITLIRLDKLGFTCKSAGRARGAQRLDEANRVGASRRKVD